MKLTDVQCRQVEQWLAELERRRELSSVYLREGNLYSAMGVACEVSGLGKWQPSRHNDNVWNYVTFKDVQDVVLPPPVVAHYGLNEDGGKGNPRIWHPRWGRWGLLCQQQEKLPVKVLVGRIRREFSVAACCPFPRRTVPCPIFPHNLPAPLWHEAALCRCECHGMKSLVHFNIGDALMEAIRHAH